MIVPTLVVCLITTLGGWCEAGADRVGACFDILDTAYCIAPVESIPLWASTYDWDVCDDYPINCDDDPSVTANGTQTGDELYWTSAACPHDWLGMQIQTPYGDWACNDRGGAVHLDWRTVYRPESGFVDEWVFVVDFAVPFEEQPYWAYLPIDDWRFLR